MFTRNEGSLFYFFSAFGAGSLLMLFDRHLGQVLS
jgi:hypothetical protein